MQRRRTTGRWIGTFGVGALLGLASPGVAASELTEGGTQPTLTHPLQPAFTCAGCHAFYEPDRVLEPWNTWAGSMMAHSARDPLFWAALDVANEDLPGAGDFCLRCHAPRAWLEGRSEEPGGTVDGCSLEGTIDRTGGDFDGVECHLCHRMQVSDAPPPGESSVYVGNARYWVDDSDCDGQGEPCRHGPYGYPEDGFPPPHPWKQSDYHESSLICGNCHDVTHPLKNLIVDGVETELAYPIERTFSEWQASAFAQPGEQQRTCQSCHMPDVRSGPAYACSTQLNDHRGDYATHVFTGGNVWMLDVLRQEYPDLGLDAELRRARNRALQLLRERTARIDLSLPEKLEPGRPLRLRVKVTNLTGHKLPTGYPEGRRAWLHVRVTDATGRVVGRSGGYDPAEALLEHDPQLKVYEQRPGIWNRNGDGRCDIVDDGGKKMFHFALNDCVELDNRIPPRGFTGGDDLEMRPVGYQYPETSPGSGVLVHWDVTPYRFEVPADAVGPLTVRAALRYQTASREYVEFLRDQAIEKGFPDDCLERSDGPVGMSRGELMHSLWERYDRSPPIALAEAAAEVSLSAGSQAAESRPRPTRTGLDPSVLPVPPGFGRTAHQED